MKLLLMGLLILTIALAGCADDDALPAGSGMIEATEVTISAQASGQVQKLNFSEGSVVAEGDTLLIIDPTKVELELASARAGREVTQTRLEAARLQLRDARETESYLQTELGRVERLVAANTGTQRQLDEIRHRHTQARIAVNTAQAAIASTNAELSRIDADIARILRQFQDAYPVSPVEGTVTEKYVSLGELLSPGRPIARIAQLDSVWVRIYLPAADFAQVKLGDPATVDTEADSSFAGTVTWMADAAEFTPKNVQTRKARADLVFAVEISLANSQNRLKVGQPVYVTIGQ